MDLKITTPISTDIVKTLKAGKQILLSGEIYTARDAAHKRMISLLDEGKPLPFDITGQTVYYAGPCPAPPGKVIGSVGPTTASRMDSYAPRLIKEGLRIMIGKGNRSKSVTEAICKHCGVYLSAVGGAGAYYATKVTACRLVAFEDLGPEAVYKLTVKDMPLIVAIDCRGYQIL